MPSDVLAFHGSIANVRRKAKLNGSLAPLPKAAVGSSFTGRAVFLTEQREPPIERITKDVVIAELSQCLCCPRLPFKFSVPLPP